MVLTCKISQNEGKFVLLLHFRYARCELIKLLDLFLPIKFSFSKIDRLDLSYRILKARIGYLAISLAYI
eukprot:UN01482